MTGARCLGRCQNMGRDLSPAEIYRETLAAEKSRLSFDGFGRGDENTLIHIKGVVTKYTYAGHELPQEMVQEANSIFETKTGLMQIVMHEAIPAEEALRLEIETGRQIDRRGFLAFAYVKEHITADERRKYDRKIDELIETKYAPQFVKLAERIHNLHREYIDFLEQYAELPED